MKLRPRIFVFTMCCIVGQSAIQASGEVIVSMSASPACQHVTKSKVISPDRTWVAELREETCEYGYVFTADSNYIVTLRSLSDRKRIKDVFAITSHGDDDRVPTLLWIEKKRLQISAYRDYIGREPTSFDGVNVTHIVRN